MGALQEVFERQNLFALKETVQHFSHTMIRVILKRLIVDIRILLVLIVCAISTKFVN